MTIEVETEVIILRPRSDVAAYMFDPRNDAVWTSGVIKVRPITEGRLRAGSRVERTVKFMGRTFSYEYQVLEADGDASVSMTVEKPFPMHIWYELQSRPDGSTLARIRTRGEPGGFFKIAGPMLAPMVRRNISMDLQNLKNALEHG